MVHCMLKSPRVKIFTGIIIAGVVFVFGVRFFLASPYAGFRGGTPMKVKGAKKATVHITEFIDFECPACAQGAVYLKKLMAEHPQAIRLELKYFPLPMHKYSFLGARYSECAGRQGKFWPFHDLLIERQANWKRLDDAKPAFEVMAQEIGLRPETLRQCLADDSVDNLIRKDKMEGDALGVKSTPTYYVNGKMVVGIKSLELELNQLIGEKGH